MVFVCFSHVRYNCWQCKVLFAHVRVRVRVCMTVTASILVCMRAVFKYILYFYSCLIWICRKQCCHRWKTKIKKSPQCEASNENEIITVIINKREGKRHTRASPSAKTKQISSTSLRYNGFSVLSLNSCALSHSEFFFLTLNQRKVILSTFSRSFCDSSEQFKINVNGDSR